MFIHGELEELKQKVYKAFENKVRNSNSNYKFIQSGLNALLNELQIQFDQYRPCITLNLEKCRYGTTIISFRSIDKDVVLEINRGLTVEIFFFNEGQVYRRMFDKFLDELQDMSNIDNDEFGWRLQKCLFLIS